LYCDVSKNDLEQIYYNCWSEYDVWKWTNYASMTCIAEVLTNAGMFTDNWINAYDRLDRYSWAILPFFFEEVGLNRVFADHASQNPASGKVMQKCGMTYEGTLRQACVCNNGIFDKVVYAMLAEDYFEKK